MKNATKFDTPLEIEGREQLKAIEKTIRDFEDLVGKSVRFEVREGHGNTTVKEVREGHGNTTVKEVEGKIVRVCRYFISILTPNNYIDTIPIHSLSANISKLI